jgi:hypothetical protein
LIVCDGNSRRNRYARDTDLDQRRWRQLLAVIYNIGAGRTWSSPEFQELILNEDGTDHDLS